MEQISLGGIMSLRIETSVASKKEKKGKQKEENMFYSKVMPHF